MNPPLTCPYCNALLLAPASGPTPTCPRCGEPLPTAAASAPMSPKAASANASSAEPTATGLSNRALAGAVIGVMVLIAGIALGYALWTAGERDDRHPHLSK